MKDNKNRLESEFLEQEVCAGGGSALAATATVEVSAFQNLLHVDSGLLSGVGFLHGLSSDELLDLVFGDGVTSRHDMSKVDVLQERLQLYNLTHKPK